MLLSARPLKEVGNVNNWSYSSVIEFTKGDVLDVYFMLIDTTLDTGSENFIPPGRRYMPVAGATLTATVENLDTSQQITRVCVQPFTNDPSIWKISFFNSDNIEGTANLRLVLTETPKITKGLLKNAFRIASDRNC